MTGTYPPWPKPLPMSPMHLTGVRDGDSEHADDRGPSRQKRKPCRGHPNRRAHGPGITTLTGVTREHTPQRPTTPEPDRAAGPR